jgi:decaprenylphospho-beta-D-erythro-pentofuranosid-2-ulose 2-reductase
MQRVLILGATSAIAREVALLHAQRGDRLHLVGRNADKLAEVARACARAECTTDRADFCELAGNDAVIQRAIAALGGAIDRVLVAHGVLGEQLETERDALEAAAVITANFTSVVSLLVPLANALEARPGSRIAVITSVAGDRGRPRNFTYGASKGALNVYLQGLRSRLYPARVAVTTIKLGPVDTPMTRDHKKNALFIDAPMAARAIVSAIDARKSEVYVPSVWAVIMPIVERTPEWLFQKLTFLSGR